jgi:hypothetical protein
MKPKPHTVDHTGAPAGTILLGITPMNQGLKLRVIDAQLSGDWGPVKGKLVLLDAGDNRHSPVLEEMLNKEVDAAAILLAIRREVPWCVNVANKSLLIAEPRQSE